MARLPVPALLAGQVVEHLVEHPTPTRSEVCAAYDALAQGYRGFVLSDETAVGRDPVEACQVAAMFKDLKENNPHPIRYGSATNWPRNARADAVSSRYVTLVARQTASPVIVVAAITSVFPRKFGPPESP